MAKGPWEDFRPAAAPDDDGPWADFAPASRAPAAEPTPSYSRGPKSRGRGTPAFVENRISQANRAAQRGVPEDDLVAVLQNEVDRANGNFTDDGLSSDPFAGMHSRTSPQKVRGGHGHLGRRLSVDPSTIAGPMMRPSTLDNTDRSMGDAVNDFVNSLRMGVDTTAADLVEQVPSAIANLIVRAGNEVKKAGGLGVQGPVAPFHPIASAVEFARGKRTNAESIRAGGGISPAGSVMDQALGDSDGFLETLKLIAQHPGIAVNPAGQTAGALIPGAVLGPETLVQLGAQAVTAGATNSSQVEQALIAQGVDPVQARETAATVFGLSTALNTIIPKAVPGGQAAESLVQRVVTGKGPARDLAARASTRFLTPVVGEVVGEGLPEELDQILQNVATGRPAFEKAGQQGALGALLGLPGGLAAGTVDALAPELQDTGELGGGLGEDIQRPDPPGAPKVNPLTAAIRGNLNPAPAPGPAKARLRPDGAGGWTAAPVEAAPAPTAAAPGPKTAPAAAPDVVGHPADDFVSRAEAAERQADDIATRARAAQADPLAPRIPELPTIEPGVTRDELVMQYGAAQTDDQRAAAAARIAAFEVAQKGEQRGEAKGEEGPGEEGQQEGQGRSPAASAAGPAAAVEPGAAQVADGPVSGDRMALESPIGQAAVAGVAKVADPPKLVVHQSTDSLPQDIIDRAQASGGVDEGVEGLYDEKNDTVHIIAPAIADSARAAWVIDHEIAHATLRSAIRRKKTGLSATLMEAANNPTVKSIMDAMTDPNAQMARPEEGALLAEEAVVELLTAHHRGGWAEIEKMYGVKVPSGVRGEAESTLKKIIDAVKKILARVTGRKHFSDVEVYRLLERAQAERSAPKRTNSKERAPHRRVEDTDADPKPMPRGLEAGRRFDKEGEHVPDTEFAKRADETHDEWEARVLDTQRNTTVMSRKEAAPQTINLRSFPPVFSRKAAARVNAQTKTPAFKRWFGDSKIVDAKGKPLVMYHGTDSASGPSRTNAFRRDGSGAGSGVYFTSDRAEAREYAEESASVDGDRPRVIAAYLSIQNPYISRDHNEFQAIKPERRDQLEADGYDGMIGEYGNGKKEYIAFSPNQIKSATGNSGNFDPLDDSIVAQRVFHGTPHEVDKFSLQKIGTGEGAQAFGWGLYFTDQESLAHSYRRNLSRVEQSVKIEIDGHTLWDDAESLYPPRHYETERAKFKEQYSGLKQLLMFIAQDEGPNAALQAAQGWSSETLAEWADNYDPTQKTAIEDPKDHANWVKMYAMSEKLGVMQIARERDSAERWMMEKYKRTVTEKGNKGRVYAVHVPDDNDLLWYDDTVADMPKKVQDSIRAALADVDKDWFQGWLERSGFANTFSLENLTDDMTGKEAYYLIQDAARAGALLEPHPAQEDRSVSAPERASHHLYTHGIPGLRFLAGGHRNKATKAALADDIERIQALLDERRTWAKTYGGDPAVAERNIKSLEASLRAAKQNLADWKPPQYNFVMWDESQISEPEIVFSRGIPLPPANGVTPLSHQLDTAREKLQDRMHRLRRLQEHVAPVTPDVMDAYTLENLMYGAAKDKLDAADRDFVKPLTEMMKRNGLTIDQLHDYLLARHAGERNARVATINPALPDGGSGISTADAAAILAGTGVGPYSGKVLDAATRNRAAAAAVLLDRARERTLDILQASQQVTPQLVNQLRAMYQHYVPLRGTESEPEWAQRPPGTGKGLSVAGKAIRRALGRGEGNEAQNISGEMIADLQRAIVQGEKAKVTQAFLRFAKANPMPDLYSVDPVDMEWKFSKASGQVYLGPKSVQGDGDRSIIVPDGGKMVRIRFEDERLRDALMHMSVQDFGAFVKYAGVVNRWRSAVLTRFNPAFTPINVMRDLFFGMTAVASEKGAAISAETMAGYIPATKALWQDAKQPTGNPNLPINARGWADWTREYAQLGVKTGLSQVEDVRKLQTRLSVASSTLMQLAAQGKPITASTEALKRALDPLATAIERVNDATENALRLSVYVAMRKRGDSPQVAGEYAKNVTINFNRKGAWGPIINAVFLFYNAAMQGTHAVQRVMRDPRVQAMLVAMAGLQAVLALSMMGDSDDDGITDWDMVPDYVKRTSLVIPLGSITGNSKDYFALPIPYGFNLFPYAGGRLAQWGKLGARPTDNSVFMDVLKSITEAFSPVPMFDGYSAMFGDTIGSLMQLASNEDDLGRPISAENPYAAYDAPKALQGKPDTPRGYQVLSQLMAKIGGGDLEKRIPPVGMLDVAPEQLEFMANFMGGGLGNIVNKGTRWWEQADADLLARPMDFATEAPIASRLLGTGKEARAVAERYYGEKGELARELDRLKDRVRSGDDPDEALADAQAEVPVLRGVELDRYKKDRFVTDGEGGHQVQAGQVKLTEAGAPKLKAAPNSSFAVSKETDRVVETANRAIRTFRAPKTTLGQIFDLLDNSIELKEPAAEVMGVEPGYNRDAVASGRVRQRAIRAAQDYREREQKRFLQAIEQERRSKK